MIGSLMYNVNIISLIIISRVYIGANLCVQFIKYMYDQNRYFTEVKFYGTPYLSYSVVILMCCVASSLRPVISS